MRLTATPWVALPAATFAARSKLMKKRALILATFAAVALQAAGASARPQTTAPGQLYIEGVTIRDNSIKIPHTRYLRGALIQYAIRNVGSRPYSFDIWGRDTAVIRPGRRDSVLINWNYRGRFLYQLLYRGKPTGVRGYIVIY